MKILINSRRIKKRKVPGIFIFTIMKREEKSIDKEEN